MTEKVTKLALTSRLIVLVLQLLANAILDDHKPDVFRAPINEAGNATAVISNVEYIAHEKTYESAHHTATHQNRTLLDKTVEYCLGGLRHWDAEYFLHIAEYTYSYENTLAFYPLYPMVVRTAAQGLHYFGLGLSLRSWTLLVAVIINTYLFCWATSSLYNLTQRIFNDLNKSWNAALLFCLNPASIFFTAAYSETLFFSVTLMLLIECVTDMRFARMTGSLALSIVCRSNGIVNMGFPIYFFMRKMLLRPTGHIFTLLKLLLCLFSALLPLTFFYSYAYKQFCLPEAQVPHPPVVIAYAKERGYVLAGARQAGNSPWCDLSFPYPYSYIQSHYWNVGFLRYYEWKQLPNFLLALPVLAFLGWHCIKYLQYFIVRLMPDFRLMELIKEYKSLPFVVHALFLTIFCTLFVHIQISTRLICSATPCLYWFAADHLPKTFDQVRLRSKSGLILSWFGAYFMVGTVMFSNNLPWT